MQQVIRSDAGSGFNDRRARPPRKSALSPVQISTICQRRGIWRLSTAELGIAMSRPTVRVIGSGSKQECFHCRQGGGGWRRMLAPHRSRAIKAPLRIVCPLPMGPYPRVSQHACAAGIFCLVRQRQLAYTPRDLLSVFFECARTMVAPRRINCCDEGQVPGGPTARQYE